MGSRLRWRGPFNYANVYGVPIPIAAPIAAHSRIGEARQVKNPGSTACARAGICDSGLTPGMGAMGATDHNLTTGMVHAIPLREVFGSHPRCAFDPVDPVRPVGSVMRMDREERIRACYQHCALKWVMSERMTNQSLRERFQLSNSKSAIASQIIAATIEAGLAKPDEKVGGSRKCARYLPFWA